MGISLAEIKTKGWDALVKELGYAGATRFILLYESGEGDYAKERKRLFKELTIEEIVREIKKEKKSSNNQMTGLKKLLDKI